MVQLQKHQQQKQNDDISQKLVKDPIFCKGQLVYLHKPDSSSITVPSRKLQAKWIGPFAIYHILDRTHYMLCTLEGKVIQDVFNFNRLKPAFIKSSSGNISNLQKLKQKLSTEEKLVYRIAPDLACTSGAYS